MSKFKSAVKWAVALVLSLGLASLIISGVGIGQLLVWFVCGAGLMVITIIVTSPVREPTNGDVAEAIDMAVALLRKRGYGGTCGRINNLVAWGEVREDVGELAKKCVMDSIDDQVFFDTYYKNKYGKWDAPFEEIHKQRMLHMSALAQRIREGEVNAV